MAIAKNRGNCFATLVGTNTANTSHRVLFSRLCDLAVSKHFRLPDMVRHVQPDQEPLKDWELELKGPPNGAASFFLAVTAPKIPGMAPIPIQKTIEGPLFSVIVSPSGFAVFCGDSRDVLEFKDEVGVEKEFGKFLDALITQTTLFTIP